MPAWQAEARKMKAFTILLTAILLLSITQVAVATAPTVQTSDAHQTYLGPPVSDQCGTTGAAGDEACEKCGDGVIEGDEICDETTRPCNTLNPSWPANKNAKCNSQCRGWDTSRCESDEKPCTAEAKICPDGSYVGRTGSDCEFAACPSGPAVITPGSVSDTLREGAVKTYKIGGQDYEVTNLFVTDPVPEGMGRPTLPPLTKLSINGEVTQELGVGAEAKLAHAPLLVKITGIDASSPQGTTSFKLEARPSGCREEKPARECRFIQGDFDGTFAQGETKSVPINGQAYEVTLLSLVEDSCGFYEAKFSVNGKVSSIGRCEGTQLFLDGRVIALHVIDISKDSALLVIRSATNPALGPNPSDLGTSSPSVNPEVQPTSVCNNGCSLNDRCVPYGTRVANGEVKYCAIDGSFKAQHENGAECQNDYECVSNQCLSGTCQSLDKQLSETQGLLSKVLSWLGKLF